MSAVANQRPASKGTNGRVKTHLHVSSKGGNLRKASSSSLSSSAAASSSSSVPATASSLASASSSVSSSASSSASSSSDGNKKSQSSDHRNNDHRKSDHGHHLQDDGLEQVTFTSSVPLSLARFQDWVCYGMPAGAVRVKGILAFDEDRLTRSVFNMSGRRRLSFENGGRWEGPMSLYLVVIGVGMDLKEVLTTLEGMRVGASSPGPSTLTRPDCTEAVETAGTAEAADAARFPFHTPAGDDDGRVKGEIARLAALLEEDPLFDMVPRDAEPACAPNVVRFRFTGAGAYGIPPSQLCLRFGVDFNAVNSAILRAVNSGTTTNVNVSRSPFLQQASRHSTALTSPDSSTNTDNSMGRHDAHDLAGSSGTADLGDKKSLVVDPRKSDPVSVASGSEKTIPVPKLFLTSQEGVHLAGDGGGEEECLVLRYAVGSKASLVDAWPMVIDRTREVVKAELGHIHFCNCFS